MPSEGYRRKNGSGLAGKVLSALMMSAQALAGAAHESWTKTVRYNRLDFAEVCCTADSQLSGEVLSRGGTAQRYSHWNGFDLTTQKGAEALKAGLDATRPRWVGSPHLAAPTRRCRTSTSGPKSREKSWHGRKVEHTASRRPFWRYSSGYNALTGVKKLFWNSRPPAAASEPMEPLANSNASSTEL